jgi:LPS O-antigen subunit length determinant protein (WzzB/FepE family)
MKNYNQEDVDINKLALFIWDKKIFIFSFSFICSLIILAYALNISPRFKSEVLLKPSSVPGLQGSKTGNLSGLASLASSSIGMNKEIDKSVEAIKIMQSRDFVKKLSERELFIPYIYAGTAWNSSSDEVIYDRSIYDPKNNKWLIDLKKAPHDTNIYKNWRRDFKVKMDKDGFILATFAHSSPSVAREILEWVINDINLNMKVSASSDAIESLKFLEKNIVDVDSKEIRNIFYSLMQEQIRIKMLTNSSSEYVFKTIDPPFKPQQKYKPLISAIVLLGAFLSAFICILFLLIIDRSGYEIKKLRLYRRS